ncbi:PTS glucose transporter subunit IIA [Bacillus sp. SA1-12]|uniref:PTS sugar transporter subunit IIA n=1 Tax=Bacillus sp. SA1-12 TaxID=1455638 RepID=UPI0006263613|nr:PTS glucose transporter subunit IIA [Bacillus sp. SA1-12]KKI92758.1 PTS glucose transporter subunit IIA [Bacillus sp. SA1-12]
MFKSLFRKKHVEQITSPVNGTVIELANVPDPVFSQKMMGEGLAVQPAVGNVVAPLDGEIVQLSEETKHAFGIRSENGIEVLVHIGLETVALKGKGFEVLVKEGQKVEKGQPMIQVDLTYIKQHASSDLVILVITNSQDDRFSLEFLDEQTVLAGQTDLVTVIVK